MSEVLRARPNTSEEPRREQRRRKITSNLGLGELALLALINPLAVAQEATTLALEPQLYIDENTTMEELIAEQKDLLVELKENEELKLSQSA